MLKDPKILWTRLEILFKISCFLLAGYMTGELFQRYLDNRDASSFTYKTFNEKAQDIYPTFSVCFQGADRRFEERPELAASWGGRLRRDVRQPQAPGASLPVLSQRPQVASGPGGLHHNLIHVTATQAPSRQIRRSPHAVSHKPNTGESN